MTHNDLALASLIIKNVTKQLADLGDSFFETIDEHEWFDVTLSPAQSDTKDVFLMRVPSDAMRRIHNFLINNSFDQEDFNEYSWFVDNVVKYAPSVFSASEKPHIVTIEDIAEMSE